MHKLLQRQLRQARGDAGEDALDLDKLLTLVDAAYDEVDRERRFTQHAYQVMRDEQKTLADRQMRTHEAMTQIRAEKAEAERARAMAEAEFLQQERLSVLGRLTATVAHELRNPLSSIRNSIHAIRELVRDHDLPLERPMSRIVRNIARCDGIISDLLEYARTRDLDCAEIALDDWLGEVLDEQRLPDVIVLERRLAAPGALVSIDDDRFRRVIEDAAASGGTGLPPTDGARRSFTRCASPARSQPYIAACGTFGRRDVRRILSRALINRFLSDAMLLSHQSARQRPVEF